MKLNFEQVSDITLGAVSVKEDDGVFSFYRFYEKEANATDKDIALCTAGIELYFKTDATALNISVDIFSENTPRSFFAVDVLCDGNFIGSIQNIKDEDCIDDYPNKDYKTGRYGKTFPLSNGIKSIRIILPHSAVCKITGFELVGATFAEPIKRSKLLLSFGDLYLHPNDNGFEHYFKNLMKEIQAND